MRLLLNTTTWRYFLYSEKTGKFKTISRTGANAVRSVCGITLEEYVDSVFKLKRKELTNESK